MPITIGQEAFPEIIVAQESTLNAILFLIELYHELIAMNSCYEKNEDDRLSHRLFMAFLFWENKKRGLSLEWNTCYKKMN